MSAKASSPSDSVRLTEWTTCGGCAAKFGAGLLSDLLGDVDNSHPAELLVGLTPFDDAAVLLLSPDLALVSTVDFFPPLVDDADDFGTIAAANACSDIFAMGGQVRLAVNVAAFPENFPQSTIVEILNAASRTVASLGGVVAGGHTIRNPEPIFGLAVQGVVHPDRIFRKGGARDGDILLLSKSLGTGLITTAGNRDEIAESILGMRTTNQAAAVALQSVGVAVHAVTDVTGFGLAGHSWEIAERSEVKIVLDSSMLPLYNGALRISQTGHRTGADPKNRSYVKQFSSRSNCEDFVALVMDPQTSGGLLAAVHPDAVPQLVASGIFTVIGHCQSGSAEIALL
jgi:selenide,water dikinase